MKSTKLALTSTLLLLLGLHGTAFAQQDETEVPPLAVVGEEGTQFDPPVESDQIPPGAWYCDMGTVHYASMTQGEGSCPICGMSLTQRPTDVIQLDDAGAQFDPPVEVEQIPPGAWYCDMGTVHYASMAQGDGSCPVCGMTLTQKEEEEAEHSH